MPDIRSLPPFDLAVLVTGVLTFIVSFFPYYGASVSGTVSGVNISTLGDTSKSVTAWHSYSTLALLLVLLGTIIFAVAIFAQSSTPELPIGLRWIGAGVCVLGALLYVIRLFTLPHHHVSLGAGLSASEGVKWGGYLLLVIILANAVCAVMSAMRSDENAPWQPATATGGAPVDGGPVDAPPVSYPPPAAESPAAAPAAAPPAAAPPPAAPPPAADPAPVAEPPAGDAPTL